MRGLHDWMSEEFYVSLLTLLEVHLDFLMISISPVSEIFVNTVLMHQDLPSTMQVIPGGHVYKNNGRESFATTLERYFRVNFRMCHYQNHWGISFASQTNRKSSNHHEPLDHHAIKPLVKNAIIVLSILLPP